MIREALAGRRIAITGSTGFLGTALELLVRHSSPGSLHYVCMDWRHQHELLTAALGIYAELKNLCIWVKDNAGMGSLYRSQHELIYLFKNGRALSELNVVPVRHCHYHATAASG